MKIFAHLKDLFLHILIILFDKLCDYLIKQLNLNPDDFNPDKDSCFDNCDLGGK